MHPDRTTHAPTPATTRSPRPVQDGGLLRLVTAGSVDDGKSTLVGRLLYDTKSVLADQLDAVRQASIDRGMATPDLSLLVDGLRSEREQGITIDVAYRYFSTPRRSFVLADTPGHVQYTRNTVTGASTAQLGLLLVDARKGVVAQTRRHLAVLALLGVRHLTLAVNKIDLVGYDEAVFTAVAEEFTARAQALGYPAARLHALPVSALTGDNVAGLSHRTPWYQGPSLLAHLETVPVESGLHRAPFRFPVQGVIRPRTAQHRDYRGYCGRIGSGSVSTGDEVTVCPGGHGTRIARIDTPEGPVRTARAGQSVTLLLDDELGVERGDLIASDPLPWPVTTFDATVCWLAEAPLFAGSRLLIKHGTRTTQAVVTDLPSLFDEQNLTVVPGPECLSLNDIGHIAVRTATPLPVDNYAAIPATGSFILIDPRDGQTMAAGLVGTPYAGDRPNGQQGTAP
ncbi:sulfate adenylyltransferase subunit 1 [Streptomyces pinistramenti]|uniref:sulfate adenylyltransferase subunit 1 n=1 Tax=Streptomyces pinistramenti TaxID=2884812 RepID=UPI001D063956|nr:GTP-binding protein [Streptomyces pinistramenti]MCB5907515.1 sulfate adenylyltransferase [Streptomyces pinistramenti]